MVQHIRGYRVKVSPFVVTVIDLSACVHFVCGKRIKVIGKRQRVADIERWGGCKLQPKAVRLTHELRSAHPRLHGKLLRRTRLAPRNGPRVLGRPSLDHRRNTKLVSSDILNRVYSDTFFNFLESCFLNQSTIFWPPQVFVPLLLFQFLPFPPRCDS